MKHPKRGVSAMWARSLVALALVAGCMSDRRPPGGGESISSVSEAQTTPPPPGAMCPAVPFDASANVGVGPCGTNYTNGPMDDCANELAPPRPSILRNYVAPHDPAHFTSDGNSGSIAFPHGPWSADMPFALPTFRTSNDGRLTLLTDGAFGLFLPENAGYDVRSNAALGRRAVSEHSYPFHPYLYFDPFNTHLPFEVRPTGTGTYQIKNMPDFLHETLCDDSGSGFERGALPQISGERNPRPCSARFQEGLEEVSGDCYDITLVVNATSCAAPPKQQVCWIDDPTGACVDPKPIPNVAYCPTLQWEIRSNDLTVFVPNARRTDAGTWSGTLSSGPESWPVWVYPRQDPGVTSLPPYDGNGTADTSYNLHKSHWAENYSEAARCYVPGAFPAHAPGAPRWCELLWSQKRTPDCGLHVDGDGDADDDPAPWNGRNDHGWALFEPSTTGDGRLLIVNMMQPGLMYSYISPDHDGHACDASRWVTFKPLSRLPRDPAIQDRYEIARAQMLRDAQGNVLEDETSRKNARLFRDTQGEPIPEGTPIPGAYLWIDRLGRNAIFSHAPLIRTGYHARTATGFCPNPEVESLSPTLSDGSPNPDFCDGAAYGFTQDTSNDLVLNPDRTAGKGQSVLGSWTQGKIVHLDNALNVTDWGGRGHWFSDRYTYEMALYNACDAQGNQELTVVRPKPSTTVFSLENQLNHFDALSPTLPFDVVWRAEGAGGVNAEIAFDDYVRNNALIVAHMNAAIDIRCGDSDGHEYACSTPAAPSAMLTLSNGRILDGFVPDPGREWAGYILPGYNSNDMFRVDPTLQNAATSSADYDAGAVIPPRSLRLRGGARVEPINAGGVLGRGVYLDGQNDIIDAAYPYQAGKTEWWIGVWLDARDLGHLRTVFFFPDESSIAIKAGAIVAHDGPHHAVTPVGAEQSVTLPPGLIQENTFFHLGVKITTEGADRVLSFTINGNPLAKRLHFSHKVKVLVHEPPDPDYEETFNNPYGFQLMQPGQPNGYTWFALGGCTTDWNPPFEGWVDELKVYELTERDLANADGFYDELICNQALGTLIDPGAQPDDGPSEYLDMIRQRISAYGYTYQGSGVAGKPVLHAFCEQLALHSDDSQAEIPRQHDGPALCVNRVHKNQTSTRCLRNGKLGIVPVLSTDPLPSFENDSFCLGCHHADSPVRGLRLPALEAGSSQSREDARRRPLFWPAAVTGNQHDDPFGSTGYLSGWGSCDAQLGAPACTALDDTFAPGGLKWFFP